VLIARAEKRLRDASLRLDLAFAPDLWTNVVVRRGLLLDTRFVTAYRGPARPGHCIYLLARGRVELDDGTSTSVRVGPSAWTLSAEELEGADGRRVLNFRNAGDPFVACEVHVRSEELLVHSARSAQTMILDDDVWLRVERLAAMPTAATDDAVEAEIFSLIDGLRRSGVLHARAAERARSRVPLERLWRGVRPLAERLDVAATLDQLGELASTSRRQLDRYVHAFFEQVPLVGGGFRSATLHLRLKLAVLFLSAEGVTATEVAAQMGYGSIDAMGRAFRDAGLPSPSVVQSSLRP
jgi:AraC-like DNA-binding protein